MDNASPVLHATSNTADGDAVHRYEGFALVFDLAIKLSGRIRHELPPAMGMDGLKKRDPARSKQPDEIGDIAPLKTSGGMLEGNHREYEVVTFGRKAAQVAMHIQVVGDLGGMIIECFGLLDHRSRHIDTIDKGKVVGQTLRQTTEAAPEIQGTTKRKLDPHAVQFLQSTVNIPPARGKEIISTPLVTLFFRIRENDPHRIIFAECRPVGMYLLDIHYLTLL